MKIDIEKIKYEKSTKELLDFGIINIDKPSGPTSFDVSDKVRRIVGVKKTSHFGTLDPKVTGVLPVALNRACKLTGFFIGEDKEYVGIMRFHSEIDREKLEKAIQEKFIGVIKQLPPVRSRVARKEREREVKSFDILEQDGKDFLFKTEVQGGTYIRKLIHDLGEHLNEGAHMLELRRTRAGIFKEDDKKYPSVSLYELEKDIEEYNMGNEKPLREIIIPGEIVCELYDVVEIEKESFDRILHGQPIYNKNLVKKESFDNGERIAVFCQEKLVGIFKVLGQDKVFAKSEFTLQPLH